MFVPLDKVPEQIIAQGEKSSLNKAVNGECNLGIVMYPEEESPGIIRGVSVYWE